MRPSRSLAIVALAAVSASATATVGCHKSSETEAREAVEAETIAAQKSAHALREVERVGPEEAAGAIEESRLAAVRARAERQDVSVAIARERRQLDAILTKEIEWADNHIISMARDAARAKGAVREERQRDVDAVRAWRDRLQGDLDWLRAGGPDEAWGWLKARIETDLDERRPPQIPHTWAKPYGI